MIMIWIEESPFSPTYGYLVLPIPFVEMIFLTHLTGLSIIYSLLVFGNFPHCEAHSTQLKTLGKISWACSSLSVQLSSLQAALFLLVLCPANRDHAGHLNVLTLFTQLKETVGLYLSSLCLHCCPEIPKVRWKESQFNLLLYYYYWYLNYKDDHV